VDTPPAVAASVADHLIAADATGHRGHGLGMLPLYLAAIGEASLHPRAEPVIIQDRGAHLTIDAGHGFGHYTLEWTVERLIGKARQQGLAGAHVLRCGHAGRLGGYVQRAAQAGFAAMVTVGTVADDTDALVAPHQGKEALLGTNPIAFGCPADPPFILDLATSTVAYYDLMGLAARGESVPEGVLLDRAGRPSTEAGQILDGGVMLAFGGYKGYALSLMAGLLSGLVPDPDGIGVGGVFALVIDLPAGAAERVAAALRRVRHSAPAEAGHPVLVPGDRGAVRAERSAHAGIEVPESLHTRLADQLGEMGLKMPPLPDPMPGSP
jgi:LDH2 family malate/lactate/ureidoglycolate dehydrogenase